MDLDDEDQAWAARWSRRLDEGGWGVDSPVDEAEPATEAGEATRPPTFAEKLAASFRTSEEMDDIPPPEPLIHEVLFMDSVAWLIGEPANGKSFVALDWAGHISQGLPWCGYPVRQGTVIYVCPEGTAGLVLRKKAWEGRRRQRMANVLWVTMAIPAIERGNWNTFVDQASERNPVLIIFDTQARMTVGMEENSAKDMGLFVDALEFLRVKTGACVLVVHHKARGAENMRGSTAMEGAATTIIDTVRAQRVITLSAKKAKDVEPFPKINLRMVPAGDSVVLDEIGPGEPMEEEPGGTSLWWATYRDRWVTAKALVEGEGDDSLPEADRIFSSRRTMNRQVTQLIEAGQAEDNGKQGSALRYRLRRPF